MANPLEALKKAQGIGAFTQKEKLRDTWETYGGMMGASTPIQKALSPAVKALLEVLEGPIVPKNIAAEVTAHRSTPRLAYGPGKIEAPKGFVFEGPDIGKSDFMWSKQSVPSREAHVAQRVFDASNRIDTPMGSSNPFRLKPAYMKNRFEGGVTNTNRQEIALGIKSPSVRDVNDILVESLSSSKPSPKYSPTQKPLSGRWGVDQRTKTRVNRSRAALSDNTVRSIRQEFAKGASLTELSAKYGSNKDSIRAIVNNHSYNWVK